MSEAISDKTLSRIDKLLMDREQIPAEESHRSRLERGMDVVAGDDVAGSYGLQLALLTAVNLGAKCFGGAATVHAGAELWSAPCLVPLAQARTLGEAVSMFGGKLSTWTGLPPQSSHLVLGNATADGRAVRLTYDGWLVAVGPAAELERMDERQYCPLAAIAAAAIAVGEVFHEFAGISVSATRRVVTLSLWRPDMGTDKSWGVGEPISELPSEVAVFGLGHLGQAYLWGLAALPYGFDEGVTLLLCDDDEVEKPNVETGALLTSACVGKLKTRTAAEWMEARGFTTRLLERRVDERFRRTKEEPVIALSGFDDNHARQWLADAGFARIFDSGLGGEEYNFDTIAFHSWPNPRPAKDIWPLESEQERERRLARKRQHAATNSAYQTVHTDECGRLALAGKSIAVPFVGAVAACVVLAELLKAINQGPTFGDLRLRLSSLTSGQPLGHLSCEKAGPIRGVPTQAAAWECAEAKKD
ncbi:hypothetical protein HI808_03190 [Ralstonia solanacearum]|nr:hypothetical protein HI812_03190 [Ralstonia solanacearum]QKL65532.1 hypothetical protein HI808_03190 [Ralstonia solanacearum]